MLKVNRSLVAAITLGCTALIACGQTQDRDGSTPAKAIPLETRSTSAADNGPVTNTPLGGVEIRGTGPVDMVLIPGLYVDWSVWEPFMDRNADKYTMYAVTLPGFGGTDAPPVAANQKYSHQTWTKNAEERIVEMIRERKLDKPVLVGHDYGARLAMRIGHAHPELLTSTVCIDAMPAMPIPGRPHDVPVPVEFREQFVEETLAPRMKETVDLLWATATREYMKGQMKDKRRAEILGFMAGSVPKPIAQRYFLEMAAADEENKFLGTQIPCMFIGALPSADADLTRPGVVPVDWRPLTAKCTKNANIKFVYFFDSDHYVMEDAPEDLDRAIRQFLAGEDVTPRWPSKPYPGMEELPEEIRKQQNQGG